MKYHIITSLLLFLIIGTPSMSQDSGPLIPMPPPKFKHWIGPVIMVGSTDIIADPQAVETEPGATFGAGISYRYNFYSDNKWNIRPQFGIEAGIQYVSGSFTLLDFVTTDGEGNIISEDNEATQSLESLIIPIDCEYYLFDGFNLAIGAYTAIRISETIEYGDISGDADLFGDPDYGLRAGIGYDIMLEGYILELDYKYQYGLKEYGINRLVGHNFLVAFMIPIDNIFTSRDTYQGVSPL